ncbi:MAG: pantoate--beta-alanine ligase [Flavobacteriales bacterium]
MEFITDPAAASEWSAQQRRKGSTVGFVPTMGALHAGHMSLIAKAKGVHRSVACSIFVNPLQFNNQEDLAKYPRQPRVDRELVAEARCDMLFAPESERIYEGHTTRHYDLGGLDTVLEGTSRPGHFQGVVNVVERLFHYVRPDAAYFGEKDRQQLTVLRYAARAERWPETLVGCATVRDSDGLALSSRNQRLSSGERQQATVLFKALTQVATMAFKVPVAEARNMGIQTLVQEPAVRIDHLEIVDIATMRPIREWGDRAEALAVIAAFVGPVRLIDNITLRR